VPLGIYVSVPFCKSKCSYCNFASGVGARALYGRYVEKVCADIAAADATGQAMSGAIERRVDTIYLGGEHLPSSRPMICPGCFAPCERPSTLMPTRK